MVLAIAALAACNNSETSAQKSVDSSANAVVDSLKTSSDSLTKPVDSAAKADSLNKKL